MLGPCNICNLVLIGFKLNPANFRRHISVLLNKIEKRKFYILNYCLTEYIVPDT